MAGRCRLAMGPHGSTLKTMACTADILTHEIDEAVRRIALEHLEAAGKARARLGATSDTAGDAVALHDFRVSVRRLRSHLRAYARCFGAAIDARQRRELKRVQRCTGAARDAEVWALWLRSIRGTLGRASASTCDELITRFERERDEASEAVGVDALLAFDRIAKKLDRRIDAYTRSVRTSFDAPNYGTVLAGLARIHAAELAEHLEDLRRSSGEDAELAHATRIAGKRLRYLLEPLLEESANASALIKELKQLQDLLGDLHDLHELMPHLKALSKKKKTREKTRRGVDEICARAEEGVTRLKAQLLADWLSEPGAQLVRDVDAFAREIEGSSDLEIERKYLLRALPERARSAPSRKLDQGYIPGERLHERIRRVAAEGKERFYRTVKVGRGIARIELEDECDRETFEVLWGLTSGHRVSKLRYIVEEGGLRWEIDAFLDRELFLAEVELPGVDVVPTLPDWLREVVVREVSEEDTYVNLNLAK